MTEATHHFYNKRTREVIGTNEYYEELMDDDECVYLGSKSHSVKTITDLLQQASAIARYFLDDEENYE